MADLTHQQKEIKEAFKQLMLKGRALHKYAYNNGYNSKEVELQAKKIKELKEYFEQLRDKGVTALDPSSGEAGARLEEFYRSTSTAQAVIPKTQEGLEYQALEDGSVGDSVRIGTLPLSLASRDAMDALSKHSISDIAASLEVLNKDYEQYAQQARADGLIINNQQTDSTLPPQQENNATVSPKSADTAPAQSSPLPPAPEPTPSAPSTTSVPTLSPPPAPQASAPPSSEPAPTAEPEAASTEITSDESNELAGIFSVQQKGTLNDGIANAVGEERERWERAREILKSHGITVNTSFDKNQFVAGATSKPLGQFFDQLNADGKLNQDELAQLGEKMNELRGQQQTAFLSFDGSGHNGQLAQNTGERRGNKVKEI